MTQQDNNQKKLISNFILNNNQETMAASIEETQNNIDVKNEEGIQYLSSIPDNSVDLILTDPPYIISKETGMNKHYNFVQEAEQNGLKNIKTEAEWEKYKADKKIKSDAKKENYMKYGTIYGKKYCVKTDYGEWDSEFTIDVLETFIQQFYKKLRTGGTMIMFFDIWKITTLKELLEKYKFKQIRFIEWIKTNP